MSRSVDLFVDAPASLDDIGDLAARAGGAAVSAEPPDADPQDRVGGRQLVLTAPDVHAVLREHGFRDDGPLALSRYRYALSVVVPDGVRPQDSSGAVFLRRVARELSGSAGWSVLLVVDLQYSVRPDPPGPAPVVPTGGVGPGPESGAAGDPGPAEPGAAGETGVAEASGGSER